METAMQEKFGRIELLLGDITRVEVDAVVNAANRSLLGGGGVDGAIHRAAGPSLLEECRALGGCETGDARITAGYRLPARHVIHTVGPVYHGRPDDPVLLTSCYCRSLELARQHGLASIAFPAISCGIYGYPIEAGSRIAIDTVRDFLDTNPLPEKVLFVLFSNEFFRVYREYLQRVTA
jgi:O-acetyl-ADP-ribose deacetylase (regulator of RNase III)